MHRRKAMQGISASVLALGATSWALKGVSKVLETLTVKVSRSKASALRTAAVGSAIAAEAISGAPPILYIQTVRYKPEVPAAQIEQLLESLKETLSRIPQIKSIRIGHVIDENRVYDYGVIMKFDSVDDLQSYGKSEIHTNWVKEHNPVALSAGHSTLTLRMD
jgi:hypothetical protein